MILILTDEHEPTTDLVIDWLLFLNKEFLRISDETPITIHSIYSNKDNFDAIFSVVTINGDVILLDTKNIESFWYRRSCFSIIKPSVKMAKDVEMENILNSLIIEEYRSALDFLYHILSSKKHINKFEDGDISKMKVLSKAIKLGIRIPDTIICSSKKELSSFWKKHSKNVINKSIGDPLSFYFANLVQFTSKIDFQLIPDTFALSLFQEMLAKKFEIRSFYLNGLFYSSAIFSQSDDMTKVDFRNYNYKKPNRVVPFILPIEVTQKLRLLMDQLKLTSGSIDIVYTEDNEYVFLEVNPIGQFEQVSFPCNYNLVKQVALTL